MGREEGIPMGLGREERMSMGREEGIPMGPGREERMPMGREEGIPTPPGREEGMPMGREEGIPTAPGREERRRNTHGTWERMECPWGGKREYPWDLGERRECPWEGMSIIHSIINQIVFAYFDVFFFTIYYRVT